jgi:hypothetical protein
MGRCGWDDLEPLRSLGKSALGTIWSGRTICTGTISFSSGEKLSTRQALRPWTVDRGLWTVDCNTNFRIPLPGGAAASGYFRLLPKHPSQIGSNRNQSFSRSSRRPCHAFPRPLRAQTFSTPHSAGIWTYLDLAGPIWSKKSFPGIVPIGTWLRQTPANHANSRASSLATPVNPRSTG